MPSAPQGIDQATNETACMGFRHRAVSLGQNVPQQELVAEAATANLTVPSEPPYSVLSGQHSNDLNWQARQGNRHGGLRKHLITAVVLLGCL